MRSRIKGCSLANVESTGLVILPQEKLYSRFLCKADCLPDSCLSRNGPVASRSLLGLAQPPVPAIPSLVDYSLVILP